ncbi:hypothetical protein ACS5NO_13805 [Larkinella sp. GY13]|uniref:hypothetical protein n=1 Tax=Larkinella sp. GY13 TaxID=3453720 RepID=UPI003EEAFFF9
MNNRAVYFSHPLLLFVGLTLLFSSCHPNGVSPSVYTLLVKQCNEPLLNLWPYDFSIDVYYFPPETNWDDAYEEVATERYSPSEIIELKATDFDLIGDFNLKLKPDQVVVLFLYSTTLPHLTAEAQLETTHGRSGKICIEYKQK